MGFLLFIIAYILYLPLTVINFCLVESKKGYFKSSAITLDKLANREFRTLWNKVLRTESGYHFGKINETISSALGKNQQLKTLTKTGLALVWLLDKLDNNHSIKNIDKLN